MEVGYAFGQTDELTKGKGLYWTGLRLVAKRTEIATVRRLKRSFHNHEGNFIGFRYIELALFYRRASMHWRLSFLSFTSF